MTNSVKSLRVSVAFLLCALISGPSATAQQALPLSLSIEPSSPAVVLGEPVYLTARLRNEGNANIEVRTDLNPSSGFLGVEVVRADGGRFSFIPLAIADREIPPQQLAPGDEMTSVFPVFFGGRGWTFGSPGRYELTAVLDGPGDIAARSEPAVLEVRDDPAGRYLFGRPEEDLIETGKFMVWQHGDHLRRAQATLDEIIDSYPDSPLADYAELTIGLNLSRSFFDFGVGRERPVQPDAALERLDAVDQAMLPPVLRIQRNLGMARAYVALDQADQARNLTQESLAEAEGEAALRNLVEQEVDADPTLQEIR